MNNYENIMEDCFGDLEVIKEEYKNDEISLTYGELECILTCLPIDRQKLASVIRYICSASEAKNDGKYQEYLNHLKKSNEATKKVADFLRSILNENKGEE